MATKIVDLKWDDRSFNYNNMVSIEGQLKCFYNAVLGAYFSPYIESVEGKRELLVEFSEGLREWYLDGFESLDDDILRKSDDFLLDNFVLNFDLLVLISNRIGKDIYILDGLKWDVWIPRTSIESPLNILYKERDSIVILKKVDKYDIIGISEGGNIYTCFKYCNLFIRKIFKYLSDKCVINSKR